jgi:hypothetical protein
MAKIEGSNVRNLTRLNLEINTGNGIKTSYYISGITCKILLDSICIFA